MIIRFVEYNSGVFSMAVEGFSPKRDQCQRKKDPNNFHHPLRVPIHDSQNQADIPRWKHSLEVGIQRTDDRTKVLAVMHKPR